MWIAWMFVFVGVLIALSGIPLALRKVPPNHLYGFRTRKTLSSPAIWYPANYFGGLSLIACGIVVAVACVVMPYLTGGRFVATMVADEAVLFGALSIAVGWSFWKLRKL